MGDRRTRDQLRSSNTKLRTAIRKFVTIQEFYLQSFADTNGQAPVPADWKAAFDAMKELMAGPNEGEGEGE